MTSLFQIRFYAIVVINPLECIIKATESLISRLLRLVSIMHLSLVKTEDLYTNAILK